MYRSRDLRVLPRHNMEDMMVSDDMNMGTINVLWIPQVYWIFVGSIIAAFTLINLVNYVLYRQRLSAAMVDHLSPAKPKFFLWRVYATLTAVARESCNVSLSSFRLGRFHFFQPSTGSVFLILAHVALVLTLCFYVLDTTNIIEYQNIAYRCGFVSLGQIPLLFLLSGKNNIIGFLTGSSYERLNYLHRWTARTLLLSTTIHMGYWFADWAPYDFITFQINHDTTTQRGLIAWCILLWIVFSSFAPIRGWSYEIFVLQHTISYIAFMAMLFLHTPTSDHGWLWAPVAIYFFDRVTRALYNCYINFSVFHPKRHSTSGKILSCHAELTPFPNKTTRITIEDPTITWKPGQHVFLSCHSVAPLQSHPFTISSLSEDGKLELFVKAHNGGTRRFLDYAEKKLGLPLSRQSNVKSRTPVIIEGPYGRMRPLHQFDSLILFAGSTGATFIIPHLRDIVRRWKVRATADPAQQKRWMNLLNSPEIAVTRRISFVWAIKARSQVNWFERELKQAMADVRELQREGKDIQVDITIYVTCDENLTSDWTKAMTEPTAKLSNAGGKLELSDSSSAGSVYSDAKDNPKKTEKFEQQVFEKEIDPRLESLESDPTKPAPRSGSQKPKTCGPDGTCCCKLTAAADATEVRCTCHDDEEDEIVSEMSKDTSAISLNDLASCSPLRLLTGRPDVKSIIRDTLEAAHGESAVVSCGPRSMNEECRRTVVALSDERAVHKGTGAQGVWFWGEGFGYA